MENVTPSPGGASAPSVEEQRALRGDDLDIDAAIEAARVRMEAAQKNETVQTEQDQDDDQTEEQAPTPVREPELDRDDTEEADVIQTPAETAVTTKPTSQEPQKAATPTEDEDDLPPMTRKQRGKFIEEIREQLAESERQRQELEASLADRKEKDKQVEDAVKRALGSEDDYNKAVEEGLAGDEKQQVRARTWKSNREFFGKLVDKARRDVEQEFYSAYWSKVDGLDGINPEILQKGTLADILGHAYQAGKSSGEGSKDEDIEKLQRTITTLKSQLKSDAPKKGATAAKSPLGGGGEVASTSNYNWRKDPKMVKTDGELTDDAEAIVQRWGFPALVDPALRKAR